MSKCYLHADWTGIPKYMREGLELYITKGIRPGGFLWAVLTNDLKGAFGRADSTNIRIVREYVQFLYSYAPAICWGSVERVNEWMRKGGIEGDAKNTDDWGEDATD